jgi:hypothetical protein
VVNGMVFSQKRSPINQEAWGVASLSGVRRRHE